MFYTAEDQKLAIYVAERLEKAEGDIIEEWYHTFLVLVDETTWPVKVLQQLHFDADATNNHSLLPLVMEGISDPQKYPNRFEGVLVFPVIGGKSSDVLDIWNNALAYAFYLKHMGIPFDTNEMTYKLDEKAVNCRSGVVATLDSIGIDKARGYFAASSGTECDKIPLRREFSTNNNPLESLLERNRRLICSLGADNYKDRYVGPIRATLHVISP